MPTGIMHRQGGGAILRQAAHFLVCLGGAWFPRKSVSEQNKQASGEDGLRLGRRKADTFLFQNL